MNKILLSFCLCLAFIKVKAQPTWADNVACIVYSHCTGCHNPKGAAPFSLLDYSTAVTYASSIKFYVEKDLMPPWPVDNGFRKMAHDRSLSDKEKSTIVNWVNNGTPQGNMSNAPAAPVYTNSEVISNPNLTLQMPTYTVPSITEDLYRCFVLTTGLSIQQYITGIEIIPGNKNIVHHVQVFYDTTGICSGLDAADPGPGYTSAGGVGTRAAILIGTWVPGSTPNFVPSGLGKRLPPGAKIVMQVHYPHYSSLKTDSTKINFRFTSASVRNISDAPVLNHTTSMVDGPLFIPKNTVKTFHEEFTVPFNATVLSIGPHGHLLCKSMKAYGVTLAGDTIPLVYIPDWDFHWQGSYDFPKPVKIPFGTKLYGEATYDNTTANPENPNNPPEDVSVGESTTDEMMLFYFSFLAYKTGDENIVIDTFSHKPHHNNCISVGINEPHLISMPFSMYPNPAHSLLTIENENAGDFEFCIYNQLGELIMSGCKQNSIDISGFTMGVYYIRFVQDGLVYSRMLVKE
jgi:hypothetical protein